VNESSNKLTTHNFTGGNLSVLQFLGVALKLTKQLKEIHELSSRHGSINQSSVIIDEKTLEVNLLEPDYNYVGSNPTVNLDVLNLHYISPEQTGRINQTIDHRSDFYSLGTIFYYLLTGKPTVDSMDPLEIIHAQLAIIPPSPNSINSSIPVGLSNIIMKLLQKSPKDRYQTAQGVLVDIKECIEQFQSTGDIKSFDLGVGDEIGQLRFIKKLYGREKEIESLYRSFERVCQNHRELILIYGYSGVGKTSLVYEIQKYITPRNAIFISGKFDQFSRNVPYSAWIEAFTELTNSLLMRNPDDLDKLKKQILRSIGDAKKALTSVIPEIESIVGTQPQLPELGVIEAQNRLNYVFQSFIKVIAKPEHPLVIFLDDLQSIDAASLNLLKILLTDSDPASLMLIGTYRNNEVDETHPLTLALSDLVRQGSIRTCQIELRNLTRDHVNEMIADILHCSKAQSFPLAEIVHTKTLGNAFFCRQLLQNLIDKRNIFFDHNTNEWNWNRDTLESLSVTDNVADIVVEKASEFPQGTQEFLKLLSCLGGMFTWNVLSLFATGIKNSLSEEIQVLENAQFLICKSSGYCFAHDYIQKAFYSLIQENERPSYHKRIYNKLIKYYPEDHTKEQFFELLRHKTLSYSNLVDSKGDLEFSEMNLKTGMLALESAAFEDAKKFFEQGLTTLPPNSWHDNFTLCFSLHRYAQQSSFLTNDYERSEELFLILENNVSSDIDRVSYVCTYITQLTQKGEYDAALDFGRKNLENLGVEFLDPNMWYSYFSTTTTKYIENHQSLKIDDVAHSFSSATSLKNKAILKLIMTLGGPAWFTDMNLFAYLMIFAFDHASNNGYGSGLPYICCGVAPILAAQHRFQDAEFFGKLGVVLGELHRDSRCRSMGNYALSVHPWTAPLDESTEWARKGFQYGMEEGEVEFSSYSLFGFIHTLIIKGEPLESLLSETEKALSYSRKVKSKVSIACFANVKRFLLSLLDRSNIEFSLPDTEDYYRDFGEIAIGRAYFHQLKMTLNFYQGEYESSLQEADKLQPDMIQISSMIFSTYANLFYSLSVTCRLDPSIGFSEEEDRIITQNQELSNKWCISYSPTFQHKHDLVEAERSRVKGDRLGAMDLYEKAIEGAQRGAFIHDEALAYELAARFYLNDGKDEFARLYMQNAHRCYSTWQAHMKVKQLEDAYPEWLTTRQSAQPINSKKNPDNNIDLTTVIKASQAIAKEIQWDGFLEKMMEIIIENAGAQKGYFITKDNGQWAVFCERHDYDQKVSIFRPYPINSSNQLSSAIVHFSLHTKKTIVLENAIGEGEFKNDPQIIANQSRSVLCLPLIGQGNVNGFIYLENQLAEGVFTQARVELLELLSSQLAISMDNALLYTNLNQRVEERTAEVAESNHQLKLAKEKAEAANQTKSEFLANMSHEIRTPMNAVLGFTEILISEETNPRKSHFLETILTSGTALLYLINDILDLSKVEAGKIDLQYEAVSLKDLLGEIQTVFERKIADKGLLFFVDSSSDIPTALVLDQTRLRQVLINLVGNALEFTNEGNIKVIAKWQRAQSQSKSQNTLILEVTDSGIGIPADQLEKVFGAFEQTKGQDDGKFGGTGLGLAISKRLVELMGGTISVESEVGKGSTFRIELNHVEVATLAELPGKKALMNLDSIHFKPARILIADDIEYNREMITSYLKQWKNFEIMEAKNGYEAIELTRDFKPDLILLDMKMPKLSGYEVAEKLKLDKGMKNIPTIAVTASALKESEDRIATLCSAYLRKPVNKIDLVRQIMNFLPHTIDKKQEMVSEEEMEIEYSEEIFSKELAALTDSWRNRALDLAIKGFIDELEEHLKEIQSNSPLVTKVLREYLEGFRFDKIVKLLQ